MNILEQDFDTHIPQYKYRAGIRVTIAGIIINIFLVIIKFIGGIMGSSSALIADAVHSASDFITDISTIFGLWFISKPPDKDHPYGHGRVETVFSFIIGVMIIITGIGLFQNGGREIYRFIQGARLESPGIIALVMAVISILSKEGMFHYTRKVGYDTGSQTLEANAWHHRSDALSSIGTVCGVGGAIFLGERWNVLDPAAAVFVSVLVMKVGLEIAWGAFHELSDESVDEEKRKTIKDAICAIDGIEDCHHIRTRSLGRYSAVDAHILVNPELTVREGHELSTSAEHAVRDAHSTAAFVTIHVEPDDGVENHVPDDVT